MVSVGGGDGVESWGAIGARAMARAHRRHRAVRANRAKATFWPGVILFIQIFYHKSGY